jgi:hypothetical protein
VAEQGRPDHPVLGRPAGGRAPVGGDPQLIQAHPDHQVVELGSHLVAVLVQEP